MKVLQLSSVSNPASINGAVHQGEGIVVTACNLISYAFVPKGIVSIGYKNVEGICTKMDGNSFSGETDVAVIEVVRTGFESEAFLRFVS